MASSTSIRSVLGSAPIEPLMHSEYSDSDSGYDEKTLSTASLRSSIYQYEEENGRSYHAFKAGKYLLPNDEAEQERMDIHHYAISVALGDRLFYAPLDNPTAVVDIGTGTGAWAIDVADTFPSAYVLGTDLSPIQPTYVPTNLEFQVADMDDPWDMDNRFDLVHTRNLHFNVKSWPKFYEEAFRSLRPGGWVENLEFDLEFQSDDNTLSPDGPTSRWCRLMTEGFTKVGSDGRLYPELMKQQMADAGFINTQIIPIKMPIGAWPKDPVLREGGRWFLVGILEGISGLSVRLFTQVLGWTPEEMELLLMEARNELKQKKVHSWCPYFTVLGQKPPEPKAD
ncbi:hypothetical protein DV735_g3969, partial [Chaetothyriales sp. CBS 134920]